MTRYESVKKIFEKVKDTDVVITSVGYISREVFGYKDRDLNFYMMGSMGNALSLGIGIALYKDTDVWVIQGDGSALMSLGTFATAKALKLNNLHNIILVNGIHESTGGQKLADNSFTKGIFNFNAIAYSVDPDDNIPPRITLLPKEITARFKNALRSINDKKQQEISR